MTRNVDSVLPLHTVVPETWRLHEEGGAPMVGDALVRTINALVGECMSVEALASVAATPEAPVPSTLRARVAPSLARRGKRRTTLR